MRAAVMDFHDVANIFPLMDGDEYAALVADIKQNGLLESIWTYQDQIIDGRNRYRACLEAGVKPRYREWSGNGSPVAFVVSANVRRRNLNESQRAMIADKLANMGVGRPELNASKEAINQHEAASMMNVSRPSVQRARVVREQGAPEQVTAVESGNKTVTQVVRELKEEKREERREANRQCAAKTPDPTVSGAKFATIVIDPPWELDGSNRPASGYDIYNRSQPTYALMPLGEIAKLPVADLTDDDCHLYLWITNRQLPYGFGLLETWGFRYVTCLTWCKPSFGMGNYFRGSTEHVLFGVKGSQPLKRKDVGTWFRAPRGKDCHSSKPVEFLDLVESCSPGPYLEMFARNEREGWTQWGAELESYGSPEAHDSVQRHAHISLSTTSTARMGDGR